MMMQQQRAVVELVVHGGDLYLSRKIRTDTGGAVKEA